jgi:ketopantoate hydroxymethyltransferase
MSRLFTAATNRFVRTCQATISRHHIPADTFGPSNPLQQRTLTRSFAAKVSALSLNAKKRKGKKITMVTAYDYPSAVHVSRAGIDMVLVGDSVAMVELGFDTTQQMDMEHMLHHCQSVKRGLQFAESGSMLIGDMPFGTYEFEDTDVALRHAYQFVKIGGCDAVKLEVSVSTIFSQKFISRRRLV